MIADRKRILVVDDDDGVRVTIEASLMDYEVTCVASARDALELLEAAAFDLMLCDFRMPEMTGVELFHELLARNSPLIGRFMLMTGSHVSSDLEESLRQGKLRVLRKPFHLRSLLEEVASALASAATISR